jgi:glyoxylate/hydroxypyruvate reductase A
VQARGRQPAAGQPAGPAALRLIQSLWAGVDRLLADPTLPAGVPIARMVDPAMNAAMAETALWAVLALHRGFFAYAGASARGAWRQHARSAAPTKCACWCWARARWAARPARARAQGYRGRRLAARRPPLPRRCWPPPTSWSTCCR